MLHIQPYSNLSRIQFNAMAEAFQEWRRDSTTTCIAVLCGAAWSIAMPESHSTGHLRRYNPAKLTWNVERRTLKPVMHDHAQLVLSRLRQNLRLLGDLPWPPTAAVQVVLTQGRREYNNSEGTNTSFIITQWEVSLTHLFGTSLRRVTFRSDELRTLSDYLIANQPTSESPTRGPLFGSGRDLPIVLAPDVAGVLIHELVGHAMEEDDLRPDQQLLPPGMDVVAEPPPGRNLDDEGISAIPHVLIASGRVSRHVRDRMGCVSVGGRPTGHAWASPHSSLPRLRLPNLRLQVSSRAGGESAPDRFVRCRAVRGARYFHGQALLDVATAELVSPMGQKAIRPCRLVVGPGELIELISLAQDQPPDALPAGICVKNGDPLPSRTIGPELLFPSASRLIVST